MWCDRCGIESVHKQNDICADLCLDCYEAFTSWANAMDETYIGYDYNEFLVAA